MSLLLPNGRHCGSTIKWESVST